MVGLFQGRSNAGHKAKRLEPAMTTDEGMITQVCMEEGG
jgi:hypothetical protein